MQWRTERERVRVWEPGRPVPGRLERRLGTFALTALIGWPFCNTGHLTAVSVVPGILAVGKLFCWEKKYRDKGRASAPHAVIIGFLCCCFRYGTLLGINTLADRGKTQQAAARALKLEKERRTYYYRGISREDTACFAQVAENELTGLPVDWMT